MTKAKRVVTFAFCFVAVSCDRAPKGQRVDNGGGERVEWVDPTTVRPGPIRHDVLTDEQMARIHTLQATFAEVEGQTVAQWVDDFRRDMDPDRELRIWERMAGAYRAFCAGRSLSSEAKRDVFRVLLLRSGAPERDVLERVQLKELSREDAVAVMKGY
jgi:hypothetical protein